MEKSRTEATPAVLTKRDEHRVVSSITDSVNKSMDKKLEKSLKGYKNIASQITAASREPDYAGALRCAQMIVDPEGHVHKRLPDKLSPLCALVVGKYIGDLPAVSIYDKAQDTESAVTYSHTLLYPAFQQNILVATDPNYSSVSKTLYFTSDMGSPEVTGSSYLSSVAMMDNSTFVYPCLKSDDTTYIYAVALVYTNVATNFLAIGLEHGYGVKVHVRTTGGVWGSTSTKYSSTGAVVNYSGSELFTASGGNLFTHWIALELFGLNGEPITDVDQRKPIVHYLKPENGATITTSVGVNWFKAYTVPEFTGITQLSTTRTIACSALHTYMGSILNNGGQITTTRLPPAAWRRVVGSYSATASRLYDVYDGPLSDGSYGWNLLSTEDEMNFIDASVPGPNFADRLSCVYTIMKRDDPTQAVRFRTFQVTEGLGARMPFERKCSIYNPHFWEMVHMLRLLPACTDNPEHSKIIDSMCNCCEREAKAAEKGTSTGQSPIINTLSKIGDVVSKVPGPIGDIAGIGKSILDLF